MTNPALEVVEFMLTARVYNEDHDRDPGDLPPAYRGAFWSTEAGEETGDRPSPGGIQRPLAVTSSRIAEATGVDRPWDAISGLMFTQREEFSGSISFSDADMAEQWYRDRTDADRLRQNPTLAAYFTGDGAAAVGGDGDGGTHGFDVSYEEARAANRPVHADRVWIDSLLEQMFDEDDEEMLDLVEVRAPEEVDMTLDDLVLTTDQEDEIHKIVKAIEHRDYLAQIGLREIGKLLFVGPPGTGKTSVARALAHELDLPFVEVKLSMITSQYLGETAKNVDKAFEVARRLAPCIFFMDEFDFVAKTRSSDEHAAIKRAVNTLLKSIDEISLIEHEVLLIGATNHPDQLDAAAWRRFDEIVNFPKPDRGMRSDILRVVTRRMDITEFEPDELAGLTEGLTGSDLRLVLREAVLDALTEERTTLTQDDLKRAVEGFEERDNLKKMDDFDNWKGTSSSDEDGEDDGHDHDDHDHDDHDHGHDHDDHDHEGHEGPDGETTTPEAQ